VGKKLIFPGGRERKLNADHRERRLRQERRDPKILGETRHHHWNSDGSATAAQRGGRKEAKGWKQEDKPTHKNGKASSETLRGSRDDGSHPL